MAQSAQNCWPGPKSADRRRLWLLLTGLPWADLGPVQWQSVGETAARLRERGEAVALTDIEIAVAAVDSSSRLWTRDSDFKRIRGVLPALQFFDPLPLLDRCAATASRSRIASRFE